MKKCRTQCTRSSYSPRFKTIALSLALLYMFHTIYPNIAFALTTANSTEANQVQGDAGVKNPSNVIEMDGDQWYETVQQMNADQEGRIEAATFAAQHANGQDWSSIYGGSAKEADIFATDAAISSVIDNVDGSYQVQINLAVKSSAGDTILTGLANYQVTSSNGASSVSFLAIAYQSADQTLGGKITTSVSDNRITSSSLVETLSDGSHTGQSQVRKKYDANGTAIYLSATSNDDIANPDGSTVKTTQTQDMSISGTNTVLITVTRDAKGRVIAQDKVTAKLNAAGTEIERLRIVLINQYSPTTGKIIYKSTINTGYKSSGEIVNNGMVIRYNDKGIELSRESTKETTITNTDGTATVKSSSATASFDGTAATAGLAATSNTMTMTTVQNSSG
jgi:hypothetical protein